MKKSRMLVGLIVMFLVLFPASWVYADEPAVAPAADSEAGAEIEAPSGPADTGAEEGQDEDKIQNAEDVQKEAASDIEKEEKEEELKEDASETKEEEKLVSINDEKVPLTEVPEEADADEWTLNQWICAALAFIGIAVVLAKWMSFRKKETAEESKKK